MSPESPWFRFFAALVGAAIVLRLLVDLIRPAIPIIEAAVVLYGVVVALRWWRER